MGWVFITAFVRHPRAGGEPVPQSTALDSRPRLGRGQARRGNDDGECGNDVKLSTLLRELNGIVFVSPAPRQLSRQRSRRHAA